MQIKTSARFVKTAPDKIRILSNLVKNQTITNAMNQLQFAGKYAAKPVILVLKQARAQIKDKGLIEDSLFVREIRVDEGPKLKRRRIRHQGRATGFLKRMSHIIIILSDVVKLDTNKTIQKQPVKKLSKTAKVEEK